MSIDGSDKVHYMNVFFYFSSVAYFILLYFKIYDQRDNTGVKILALYTPTPVGFLVAPALPNTFFKMNK